MPKARACAYVCLRRRYAGLSIDPLAELAEMQEQLHRRLIELAPDVPQELRAAWQASAKRAGERQAGALSKAVDPGPEQFLLLITWPDEREQVEQLQCFRDEDLECKALLA